MGNSFKDKLISMLSNADDKKISEAVDKAMQIMQNNNLKDISSLFNNSRSKEISSDLNPELIQMIDKLPDTKKMALWEKFNSPEIQQMLKTDKNKAIEMLKKTIMG